MCLLSFVYYLINGSIDQYITNDTVGVNDNPGLGRIRLPRTIDRLAAVSIAAHRGGALTHTHKQDQPETVGSASSRSAHPPYPLPNNCTIRPFHPSQHSSQEPGKDLPDCQDERPG